MEEMHSSGLSAVRESRGKLWWKKNWWKILRELYLLVNIFFMLFPFVFMILNAARTNSEFQLSPMGWPADFTASFAENIKSVWTGIIKTPLLFDDYVEVKMFTPFPRMFGNSLLVTMVSLAGLVLASHLFGYALGTKKFRGKGALIVLLVIVQAVPFFGYITPMYMVADWFNLVNRLVGLVPIYIAVAMPMVVILFQGYFSSFPKEIEEAALIDGCSELRKYVSIVVPLSMGAIATMAIINFMGYWNEYAIANLLIGTQFDLRTINIGVMLSERKDGQPNYVYQFMLLTLSAIPNFVFFTIFQRYILNGLTLGGVKG